MLICHYTHPLLGNMLAVISSCKFICWFVYCFSVTAVASLLTCAIWEFDLCNIDNIAQVNIKALGSWLIEISQSTVAMVRGCIYIYIYIRPWSHTKTYFWKQYRGAKRKEKKAGQSFSTHPNSQKVAVKDATYVHAIHSQQTSTATPAPFATLM